MIEYLDTPLFGITLTVIVFSCFNFINKKTNNPLLNPIALSLIFIIWFLNYNNINVET